MEAWKDYYYGINEILLKIVDTQQENMIKAAKICAETTKKGGIIYAFGCWHSMLIAQEQFYRAASPANFMAICEPSLTGATQLSAIGRIENCYGIGETIVDYWRINPEKDCLILISNSGNNIVTVEAALRAKEKKIPLIGITSTEYADTMITRHKSAKKLKDVVDVVLDNCCPIGDAICQLEGLPLKTGPASGILMNFLMSSLFVQMEQLCLQDGVMPEIYYNGHVKMMTEEAKAKYKWLDKVDAAKHNLDLIDKYYYRIKTL